MIRSQLAKNNGAGFGTMRLNLNPFFELFSEKSLWTYQENPNDDQKGKSIFEGNGDITTRQAFNNTQENAHPL